MGCSTKSAPSVSKGWRCHAPGSEALVPADNALPPVLYVNLVLARGTASAVSENEFLCSQRCVVWLAAV